jgi:hypothetical protein
MTNCISTRYLSLSPAYSDEELDKDQLFVTMLNPGRDVDPTDRMKEIPKV